MQPWTRKNQNSSRGKYDRETNEGEDKAEETDEDKDEVLFNEEDEREKEKAEDEMSQDDAADKKRNHGVMSHDRSRVDNDQTRKLCKWVDQTSMTMEED